jgi:GWxTD domain-containing protein
VHGAARRRAAVYYEVYDLRVPPPEGKRRYEISYRIRNSAGEDVREWSRRLASSSAAWADTVGFQVDELLSDSYRLSVMVRDQETAARAVIEGGFEVFWTSPDWVTWIEEYDRLGLLFLDTPDYERLTSLGIGSRERFLAEFWESVNPEPEAPVNVVREEFMRRVRFANERYTNNLVPGIETDRGRVYIRFGEPDDVRREIIPIQGNDLNTAIMQLERESSGSELSGIRGIDGRGDDRAFEVWVYNQRGYQLFPRDEQMSTGVGMQFIFVDDLGTGQNYRLIRSTQPFDF